MISDPLIELQWWKIRGEREKERERRRERRREKEREEEKRREGERRRKEEREEERGEKVVRSLLTKDEIQKLDRTSTRA